jgi:hypothetical protein
MAPPGQCLEADDLAVEQADDRLVDDGDGLLGQQLAQLAGAGGEPVRQLLAPQRSRGRLLARGRRRRIARVRAADAELEVREVQHVALGERGVLDDAAVEVRAVGAAEVAHAQAGPAPVDLGVQLRDGVRGQHQLEPLPAADAERQDVQGDPPQPRVLAARLQVPAAARRFAGRLVAHGCPGSHAAAARAGRVRGRSAGGIRA